MPFPELPSGDRGYSIKTGPAMDLANRQTWGLLAPEVNRRVEDMDALMKRFNEETPVGGERTLGQAQMLKGLGGDIYSIRQDMLSNALQGVAGLAGAKKGYNPAGYSGSGQAMLSDSTTRRGQDIQNTQFGQNLDFQKSALSQQLAAQRQQNQNSLWSGLLQSLGTLGGALITHSDERVKEDVEPFDAGLEEIGQLRPYTWNYIPAFGGEHSAGFMAQDLEGVIPDAVGEVDGVKTVNLGHVLAAAVNAIQELEAKLSRIGKKKGKK